MASYMPQYIFNMCAVTTAKLASATGKTFEITAKQLCDNYRKSYDDSNLEQEIVLAAISITEFFKNAFPNDPLPPVLTQLQFSIMNFEPDGNKRKKKLLSGTWFNKEKKELPDKVKKCIENVATYHLLLIGGSLPLAPSGWSINT